MGYATKRVKRRRASCIFTVAQKLVLLGARGSHDLVWDHGDAWATGQATTVDMRKRYWLEMDTGGNMLTSWHGFSANHLVMRVGKIMEVI